MATIHRSNRPKTFFDEINQHPHQAIVLALVDFAVGIYDKGVYQFNFDDDIDLLIHWAMGACSRWARGEASLEELRDCKDCFDELQSATYSVRRRVLLENFEYDRYNPSVSRVAQIHDCLLYKLVLQATIEAAIALEEDAGHIMPTYEHVRPILSVGISSSVLREAEFLDKLGKPGQWGITRYMRQGGYEVVVSGDYIWCGDIGLSGCFGPPERGEHAVMMDMCLETIQF